MTAVRVPLYFREMRRDLKRIHLTDRETDSHGSVPGMMPRIDLPKDDPGHDG